MRFEQAIGRGAGLFVGLLCLAVGCGDGAQSSSSGGGGAGASTGGTTAGTGGASGSTGGAGGGTGGTGGAPLCAGLTPIVEPAERLYVAPDGDDAAAGTEGAPLASVVEAASRFSAGGTVIVRGGVYGPQHMDATGTPDHPLVIRAAQGETPIFEGTGLSDMWDAVFMFYSAENVVLQGLEIRNCTAPECSGIDSAPVSGMTVRECHIHHVEGSAARFTGNKIRIEGNHFHDVALTNVDNAAFPDGGWPTCTGTTPDRDKPDSPNADDVVIRDNLIEDCWGEGIGVWFGSHVLVEGNVIKNPFNVGIYMDNSFSVTVARNFVQVDRGIHGGHGTGILMGTEPYVSWGLAPSPSQDIEITNNVVTGGSGIGWWSSDDVTDANRYQGVRALHNTIVTTSGEALSFDEVAAGIPAASGCEAVNNVLAEASESYLGDPAAWSFASNAWLGGATPAIAGATDVSLSTAPPAITKAEDAKPLASEVGAGEPSTGVLIDYACQSRDPAAPTRGAFEP